MQRAKRFTGYGSDIVSALDEYLKRNPNERIVKMINLADESLLVIFEIE
jgi:hypothetical protein